MIRVGVSGAAGRMGRLVAQTVAEADGLELGGRYAPGHGFDDPSALAGCEVVVEFTRPEVVMGNLRRWRDFGCHVVVGTSGFDEDRLAGLAGWWGEDPPNCLICPNFSIGAVLMMGFAETAARFFQGAEIVELHHEGKADAPSGTALSTAQRVGARLAGREAGHSGGIVGVRGSRVSGVPVHSVRLPGLVAHQEVLFGNPGELLTIRHDSTDRASFLPGVLLAIRRVAELPGVTVGLEALLGL
ncbi:MAG: 4-hydroxy-tetrahydrodipicolinate reductase [Acidimicrobiia bacterium]